MKWKAPIFAMFIVLILAGCPVGTPPAVHHFLTGKVIDLRTGVGVPGATVELADLSATTASDGSFSIGLGSAGGTVSGSVCVYAAGYGVIYAVPVSVDAGKDTAMTVFGWPSSPPLTTRSVKIKILDSTSTEIPVDTNVMYAILNSAGGSENNTTFYSAYVAGGIVVESPTFGTDCLVAATAFLGTRFSVMARQLDLSALSTTVTLTQDSVSTTTVNLAGDTDGNGGTLSFMTPYGSFLADNFTLAGSPAVRTISVANPYGYGASWMQGQTIANYLGSGLVKTLVSVSSAASVAANVTLPAVNTSLGPNAIPDSDSIGYGGGVLSIAPVSGTDVYAFLLLDETMNTFVGFMLSTGPSVTLPQWLQSQLDGHSVRVAFVPLGTNLILGPSTLAAAITVAYMGYGYGVPPVADGLQFGMLGGSAFFKVLAF